MSKNATETIAIFVVLLGATAVYLHVAGTWSWPALAAFAAGAVSVQLLRHLVLRMRSRRRTSVVESVC